MRHYRRVRPVSNGPKSRRPWLVVLGVGVGLLATVAAVAVGSFVIGNFTSHPQSAAGGIPNAPAGVTFGSAGAQLVSGSTTPATGGCAASNLGNATHPTNLTNGTMTSLCMDAPAGGFSASDTMYTLQIVWGSSADKSTVFKILVSIDVTPASHDLNQTLSFVRTSATIVNNESAVYALDLTAAGDLGVTSYGVLVTECSVVAC
jgi:hypothetical protein